MIHPPEIGWDRQGPRDHVSSVERFLACSFLTYSLALTGPRVDVEQIPCPPTSLHGRGSSSGTSFAVWDLFDHLYSA